MKKIIAICLLSLASSLVSAQGYTLMTIKQKEKDNAENFFVEVTQEMFKRAGLTLRTKPGHWIRAQRAVISGLPDHKMVITPITRTEQREEDYDWIVPLESYQLQLVSNDKTLNIKDTNILKDLPVCALRESPAEHKLRELGFTNIKAQVQAKNCFKQLAKGKIKLVMAHGDLVAKKRYKSVGGNPDDLVYGLSFRKETLYLASTRQAVAKAHQEKLKSALDAMKQDGTYQTLRDKY